MDAAIRKAEKNYQDMPCKETATAYWLTQARMGKCILSNFDAYSRSVKLFAETFFRSRDASPRLARELSLLEVERRAKKLGRTVAIQRILASHPHRDVRINFDFWVWTGDKHEIATYEMFYGKVREWLDRRNNAVDVHINL